jgi:hypothetical protein
MPEPCNWPHDPCPNTGVVPGILLTEILGFAEDKLLPHDPSRYAAVESRVRDCERHSCSLPTCHITHEMHCQFVAAAHQAAQNGDWNLVIDELDHDCTSRLLSPPKVTTTDPQTTRDDECEFANLPSSVRRAIDVLQRHIRRHGDAEELRKICECLARSLENNTGKGWPVPLAKRIKQLSGSKKKKKGK